MRLQGLKSLCQWRRVSLYVLAFIWCFGLFLGTLFASQSDTPLSFMMRLAADSPVSVVTLMAGAVLPFLLTACAVWISKPQFILLICFLKGFIYAFCAHGSAMAFGAAFWIFRLLLLFTDHFTVVMLMWFWVRNISGFRDTAFRDLFISVLTVFAAGLVDICLISPFLALVL